MKFQLQNTYYSNSYRILRKSHIAHFLQQFTPKISHGTFYGQYMSGMFSIPLFSCLCLSLLIVSKGFFNDFVVQRQRINGLLAIILILLTMQELQTRTHYRVKFFLKEFFCMNSIAIPVVEFSREGYKIRKVFG